MKKQTMRDDVFFFPCYILLYCVYVVDGRHYFSVSRRFLGYLMHTLEQKGHI